MDLRKVVSWIGVFALALASLISMVRGGFISALLGVLLVGLLVSSLIPLPAKLAYRVPPRLLLMHRMISGTMTVVGCWMLAGFGGGWEFVPAAVVLSVSLVFWPAAQIIMKRRRERNAAGTTSGNGTGGQVFPLNDVTGVKPMMPLPPPPIYTSTVKIVQDDCKQQQATEQQCPIIQTPIFNV